MRAPERGWPSVLGRLAGLVGSAALLAWSAATSPAIVPDDGPSTQSTRTVSEDSPQRQRELERLVRQGRAEPDSGERQLEPDDDDQAEEQADREQDAAEEQADREQDAAEEQADREQDAAEEGDEGDD